MSTHSFTGIRVTTNGSGVATAVTSSAMTWTTSEFFRFKYTLDAPVNGGFSSITVALASPSNMVASNVSTASGAARTYLDSSASIGQYSWGVGNETTVMIVRTSATEFSLFALAGDALPAITNLTSYNNFLASVTGLTSVLPTGLGDFGHSTLHNMTRALSYVTTTENDTVVGVTGVDDWTEKPLETGKGNDNVTGTNNDDWIRAGDNADIVWGMGGNDRLYGEIGNDNLYGGLGNDSLYGGNGNDQLFGDDGNDSLSGGKGNDTLYGQAGADRVNGESGDDIIVGDVGNDTLYGGSGNDTIYGNEDNDVLRGERGLDLIYGGDGDDDIDGGTLEDLLYGGNGNDTIDGGSYNDTLLGEAGHDSLNGASGNDLVYGGEGNDTLKGYTGNDTLYGGDGDDSIDGGNENDLIDGGLGNDYLRGASGDDTILSGLGDDTMIGYSGADTFVIEAVTGHDVITDFRGDYGDRIFISDDLAVDVETAMGLAEQDGTSVVFDFGSAGSLTIQKTTLELVETYLQIWDDASDYM